MIVYRQLEACILRTQWLKSVQRSLRTTRAVVGIAPVQLAAVTPGGYGGSHGIACIHGVVARMRGAIVRI